MLLNFVQLVWDLCVTNAVLEEGHVEMHAHHFREVKLFALSFMMMPAQKYILKPNSSCTCNRQIIFILRKTLQNETVTVLSI